MKITSFQVGVAAEAIAAAQFARAGFHVSVQYGANQPGYDLIVEKDFKPLLISVKGSQTGKWGLTQNHLTNADYQGAADKWLEKHGRSLVFCFVQFLGKAPNEMPELYLATSMEVATQLKLAKGGVGNTILHVSRTRTKGVAANLTDFIPPHWIFSQERVDTLFRDS